MRVGQKGAGWNGMGWDRMGWDVAGIISDDTRETIDAISIRNCIR